MRTVLRTLASLVLALWIVSTLLQSASAQSDDAPDLVVIPGTLQSKLGCPGDWQPECENTALALSEADGIWRGVFDVPAGAYEYKVALNGSWAENYGALAKRDGPNIPLGLESATTVRFYYDHVTHWVADSATSVWPTAPLR